MAGNELLTEEESKKIKEFKALYYELNAKPDTTTKLFPDKVVVKMEDLVVLENMIKEKLNLHSNEGKFGKSYVNIVTSKHKSYNFDDWKLFQAHNWRIPEYIESITLVWDFYICVNGYKNPQRHKLTVRISSGLKFEEVLGLIFSGNVEDIQSLEEMQAPIVAQMDFIENRLGQEFLNLVEEWVQTLDKAEDHKNKIMIFLKKKRKYVAYFLNYLLFIIACITSLLGFNYITSSFAIKEIVGLSIQQLNLMVNYTTIVILICLAILNRGEHVANKVFKKLDEYGDIFVFRITNGDERQYNSIKHEDKLRAFKVMVNIIFTLILNIACSIIASIVYSKL
ncbi:MAG: hypothetical protein HDR10_02945 [Lachnospiraceae bacterium]|nr:hypothetical protein [Lachnospiraceae bacterium]